MARYFYHNEKGEKRGAFSGKEIKAMAKAGLIKPDTAIETEDRKQYHAHGIDGIEFGKSPIEFQKYNSPNLESPKTENISNVSSVILPKSSTVFSINTVIPTWLDDIDERKAPQNFCDLVGKTIQIVQFISTILAIGWFVVLAFSLALLPPVSVVLFVSGAISIIPLIVLYYLTLCFLKSIRSSFCNQLAIEKHIQIQTEILEYSNNLVEVED